MKRLMMKASAMVVLLVAILLPGRDGRAEARRDSWIESGRHEVDISLSMSRLLAAGGRHDYVSPGNAGWAPGLAISYGYFATEWLKLEAQAQLDVGLLTDHGFLTGLALGGASVYFKQDTELQAFVGLRLGGGFLLEGDSDGGLAEYRPSFVIAPKAGIQLQLTDRIGLHAYLEYQGVFVHTNNGYAYGDRHMIRLPVGVSFVF